MQRSKKDELARVDRELAEIAARADIAAGQVPAFLVTLGVEDWEMERRLIEAESE